MPPKFNPRTVSYSGLTVYDECSMLYKLQRIDRVIPAMSDTNATRIGTFCHTSLEHYYGDETGTVQSPYDELTRAGGIWDQELESCQLQMLRPKLQAYAHHTTALYERASASYKGKDAIRKKDGAVSAAPHMTKAWTDYARQHGLNQLSDQIDQVAAKVAPERWEGLSLSQVYAESLGIMYPYRHPADIDAVVAIELPVSEIQFQGADEENQPLYDELGQPVPTSRVRGPHPMWVDDKGQTAVLNVLYPFYLPALDENGRLIPDGQGDYVRREDLLFTGYIDLVARNEKGELLIIDHKTNAGEVPSRSKISRHEQMLVYGFMVTLLGGEQPAYVGMNHLRSGKLVLAEFSMAKAEVAVERLLSIVSGIEKKVFVRQNPDGYHSRCVVKPFREGEPPRLCPGLPHCHPEVAELYNKMPG